MRIEGYSFNNSNPTFGYGNVKKGAIFTRHSKLLKRTIAGVNVGKAFNELGKNFDYTATAFHGPFDNYVTLILKPYKPGKLALIAEKIGIKKPKELTNNPLPEKIQIPVANPDKLFKMDYEELFACVRRETEFNMTIKKMQARR